MSITTFPAEPGTRMIEYNSTGCRYTPVVGWTHIQGAVAFPVCVLPHGGLTVGRAIAHPDGTISDPTLNEVFREVKDWIAATKTALEKQPNTGPAQDPDVENGEDAMNERVGPSQTSGGPYKFGTNTYKTNSYWHDASGSAIFMIEGGDPLPNDPGCVKVTREEYAALKKSGCSVVKPLDIKDDPATDDSEDDADDAMDLI